MKDALKITNELINKINPNTKIVIKRTIPSDVSKIDLRDEQVGSLPVPQENLGHVLCMDEIGSNSIFINGILVFVGGIVPKWTGVGEGWLLVDKALPILVQPYKKEFFIGFNYYMTLLGYDRIETSVLKGFDQGIKFIEGLGFEKEGLMKKYGPDGKDYWRYAYLKKTKEKN